MCAFCSLASNTATDERGNIGRRGQLRLISAKSDQRTHVSSPPDLLSRTTTTPSSLLYCYSHANDQRASYRPHPPPVSSPSPAADASFDEDVPRSRAGRLTASPLPTPLFTASRLHSETALCSVGRLAAICDDSRRADPWPFLLSLPRTQERIPPLSLHRPRRDFTSAKTLRCTAPCDSANQGICGREASSIPRRIKKMSGLPNWWRC